MSDVNHERRHAPRVEATGNVPGQLEINLETHVIQISPGGMMAELEVPVTVGSEYEFTLSVEGEDLELRGVVRNCEPKTPGDTSTLYRVGIEFRSIDEKQQEILTRFVESKL
jgi:c-di-GMP-binding flagellar brake protein YcgR